MFRKASSPTINQLSCRDWKIEAIIRFLLSNPAWRKNTDEINEIRILTDSLRQLEPDQTLFIQSGEPVAVVRTNPSSPMLISSEATDSGRYMERNALEQSLPNFYAFLEVQGMIQYFSEKMDSLIKTFFHGKLGGKLTLSTGLNEMAMIPPLIVTKNGGVCITIEPNSYQIQDGLKNNYYDIHVPTVNDAISLAKKSLGEEAPLSIVLLGNSKEVYQEFIARNVTPEIVIDQTKFQPTDSAKVIENYKDTLGIFEEKGSLFFDLSGSIGFREAGAWTNHIFPSPLSNVMFQQKSQERMPLQWIALSGKPDDIYKIDEAVLKEFKHNKKLPGGCLLYKNGFILTVCRPEHAGLRTKNGWICAIY
ncbi:urocanate hydratase [Bacillus freudenreichii]|nr:urocanate hydratase [Bacillus freudenreichii]